MSYSGKIDTYTLGVQSPSVHTNYKRTIYLKGSFGLAMLYFVPPGGSLGTNKKRDGSSNVFDIYYYDDAWAPIVDMLRNESPVYFFFDDYKNGIVKTSDEAVGEDDAP